MSKSRKKNIKDRFEKKKMIAFKNKNKKNLELEKEDEDTEEEIFLQTLRHEDTSN